MHFLSTVWGNFWRFLLGGFRRPVLWWVKMKVTPQELPASLNIDPNRPVCFVLPSRSISDLWVMEKACEINGLKKPRKTHGALPTRDRPAYLFLPALLDKDLDDGDGSDEDLTRRQAKAKQKTSELRALLDAAIADKGYDVQIVPVSIIWGRDPGKETSLFKIMFYHSERAGPLRKLFIILANGRNTLVHFAEPISFRSFMEQGLEKETALRKLFRLMRVHFRRQRVASLGPQLIVRSQVINELLRTPGVQTAIHDLAAKEGITVDKARKKARKYADELAADYSVASLRFLERVLTLVWNRMYKGVEVYNMERVRHFARDHSVLYLPSHRSHADYLLLSYVLYQHALACPHIAAGINLNFFPVGGLLRRCGAFYMRRTFAGNKLYTAIFRSYVDALIRGGFPISFYPEGGRSRTGRLLQPKTGMLSMILQSALRNTDRPVVIVPVYIGYDRIMEVNSYFKELRGKKIKRESAGELLKARKVLESSHGKAYISFGEPLSVHEYLDANQPDWRSHVASNGPDAKPLWLSEEVSELADQTMTRINASAVINPVGIVAMTLLATPQRAVADDELHERVEHFLEILRAAPYSADIIIPDMPVAEIIREAESISGLQRASHAWGDIVLAQGKPAVLLTYYRNNIQHLFALPSLIASFIRAHDWIARDTLIEGSLALYPLMQHELFLRWSIEQCRVEIDACIDVMLQRGLIEEPRAGRLAPPPATSREFGSMISLARVCGESLERHSLTTMLLAARIEVGHIERGAFEEQCQLMAERLAILSGRNAPEFFDKNLFRGYIENLIEQGLLTRDQMQDEDTAIEEQRLFLDADLEHLAEQASDLLGQDVKQSILQLISRPTPIAAEPSTEEAA